MGLQTLHTGSGTLKMARGNLSKEIKRMVDGLVQVVRLQNCEVMRTADQDSNIVAHYL